ncbi:MAG: D-alanyl-D-alanine carboxypeptidase [Clostridia bacterium]|nr:D-alanyl-D-alanine carboxypeptidase [Clostridia bacterium]
MKKKIFWLCILLIFVFTQVPLMAAPVSVSAPAYILIDGNSGITLSEKNADKKMYPASTTKIMTAILAIENCNMDDVCTATFEDVNSISWDSSKVWLSEFEEMTVRDLVFSLLVVSANDAANVLGRHISGDLTEFAKLMTKRAAELGCTSTNFVNAHGLHHDKHYTTPRDLAIIARHAMTLPLFRESVATREYKIAPTNRYEEERNLKSTNHLLNPESSLYYEYANGIKTGYTVKAGNCLVSSAQSDRGLVISVVMGADKKDGKNWAFIDSKKLLQHGLEQCQSVNRAKAGQRLSTLPVSNAKDAVFIPMLAQTDVNIILPEGADPDKIKKKEYNIKDVSAPFTKGQVLGRMEYWYEDTKVGETMLVADKDYEYQALAFIIHPVKKAVKSWWFWVLLVLILLYWMYLKEKKKRERRRRRLEERRMRNNTYKNMKE